MNDSADLTLTPDEERLVLQAAMAAPSMHNTQPWRFTTGDGWIEVGPDPARQLPAEDPDGRAAAVACGAAVFNARVALDHLGYAAEAATAARAGGPYCRLTVTGRGRVRGWTALYAAIEARRTNRYPYRDEPVPAALVAELCRAAAERGAALTPVDDEDARQRLTALVHAADAAERDDDARAVERARWIHGGPRGERADGMSYEDVGPRPDDPATPFRDLAPGVELPERPRLRYERHPEIAVLHTPGDTPEDWLRAGQALEHVLLLGALRGLAFSFANHPLEHVHLRQIAAAGVAGIGYPQILLRLGYPTTTVPPTPRRPEIDAITG